MHLKGEIMVELNTYQERLALIIDKTGPKALSDETGISTSMLQRYKKEVNPTDAGGGAIDKILKASGFSGLWLFHGVGPQYLADIDGANDFSDGKFLQVESITGSKSGDVTFDQNYLQNFLKVDPENARHLSIRDDCMAPTYNENDLVLVDVSRKAGAGVFVIEMGGEPSLRQANVLLNGNIDLMCENPKYPTNEISQDEFSQLKILGRVVWSGGKA